MCGICGKVVLDGVPPEETFIHGMCDVLAHRGPDAEGVFIRSAETGGARVGLGHRRLSVIDLSDAGKQPMPNEDETIWLVFNGEIYNFRPLLSDLRSRGHRFRSRTDSEVILHLYEEEGERLFPRLRGMFALAIWDDRQGKLILARDRLGEKPLVYARVGRDLVFASEMKAIRRDPAVRTEINPLALHHYLTFQYVPTPMSAFAGIEKLPPGHYLTWQDGEVRLHRYWALVWAAEKRVRKPLDLDEVLERLDEAVRIRMVSDVPVGAFLSGGLDSSSVVALMSRHSGVPIRTLTVGFRDRGYDERDYARILARQLNLCHSEVRLDFDVEHDLPKIAWHYDEPFADASAVPTYYLSRAMRSLVKVAMDGDGGDETLAGYDRYRAALLFGLYRRLPASLRDRGVPSLLNKVPLRGWERAHWLHRLRLFVSPGEESMIRRFGQWKSHFTAEEKAALYTPDFAKQVEGADSLDLLEGRFAEGPSDDALHRLLHTDMNTYLPDDLLVKMDVASMAHGLEMRAPFLDHQWVEFLASIPSAWKLRRGRGKFLLRACMKGILPREILERRKMGFSPPIAAWIGGELRDAVQELLLGSRVRERGYFSPKAIGTLLDEHLLGIRNRHHQIWNLMMLELWHRVHVDRSTTVH
jgi:asparagine synthase (glutamine-hydrolysing)